MKKQNKACRGMDLVTAEEKPTSSQPGVDRLIANGMRRYQELQREFDRELFGKKDLQKLAEILPELQLLRERLSSYGVHVRV